MKETTIEELAYFIKQAKADNQPQPIFFLGAGASVTGGIPLANSIVKDILEKYPDNPRIKKLREADQTYPKLMECLSPQKRNELLKNYIDEAKINVTHIYLAQLLKHGFVDYVLTVNFDNLMLRALALYNIYPSTYDMAILRDLTTTDFNEKSVVYLHGQHHGPWLLNTVDEMDKVKDTVLSIFHSIKNKRPWIFIGYSGLDPVFNHIKSLGRFDNDLYWVGYKDHLPERVVQDFLNTPNTNAYLIKGYDADSFMLKLNQKLGLGQPKILDKPFSALGEVLHEIKDINDEEHFKRVKERLEITKKYVGEAIKQFEEGKGISVTIDEIRIDILRRKIIELIVSENYDSEQITEIEEKANSYKDKSLYNLLSDIYYNWANHLGKFVKTKQLEDSYKQVFEKFQKATKLNPDNYKAFNNWGNCLGILAETKKGMEADDLYQKAFEKFQIATGLKQDYFKALYNWGNGLVSLAETKEGNEADDLYQQAYEKYQQADQIKPNDYETLNNWGSSLGGLAETKQGKEAEDLYQQAFDKYQQATLAKPDEYNALNNWGIDLRNLAETKESKESEDLYDQAIDKYQKAIDLGGISYNLACLFSIRENKLKALRLLQISLDKKEITADFVVKDKSWKHYLEDKDFKELIKQYRK